MCLLPKPVPAFSLMIMGWSPAICYVYLLGTGGNQSICKDKIADRGNGNSWLSTDRLVNLDLKKNTNFSEFIRRKISVYRLI